MAQILLVGTSEHLGQLSALLETHKTTLCPVSQAVASYSADRPDLVLVDLGAEGALQTLRELRLGDPAAMIIALSEKRSVAQAIQARRDGAMDYVELPLDQAQFDLLLEQVALERQKATQLSYLRAKDAKGTILSELVGQCKPMQRVFETVLRLARRTVSGSAPTVLLNGETGTGKGCIARAIHYNGRRRDAPFVEVGCAAIPEPLLEGELFGHEQGAYTDARIPRIGLIETALGGTLFLDEVSCLPLSAQAKLLTFLEEKMIRRLGSSVDRVLDVQVVAATNRDLSYMAEQGLFRVDLLHRLMVVTITLPPLRERGQDRVKLAEVFLQEFAREYGQPVKQLSRVARKVIETHLWLGNVRELRNAIERVVLLEDDLVVERHHLQLHSWSSRCRGQDDLEIRLPTQGASLEEVERLVIQQALEICGGNIGQTAHFLNISRPTLRYRLKKHKLSTASGHSRHSPRKTR